MECPVCYREWDSEKVIPRNLPCGHSYCEEDLVKLFKVDESSRQGGQANQPGKIECPTCCMEHNFQNKSDIYQLIKNWAVLQYAETFAKQKKELAAMAGKTEPEETKHLQVPAARTETQGTGQEPGVKDCSVIGLESGANSSIIDNVDGVRRSTVSQFQDEDPPIL